MKIILSAALVASAAAADYTPIAGFNPLTDVRDQLRIDLDQQKIMELLDTQTEEGFVQAKTLYEEGAFSKSVSDLTIEGGLATDIAKGTKMQGVAATASGGGDVSAQQAATVDVYAVEAASAGDTTMRVQYVNEGCYVGANPDPVTIGCLAPSGSLTMLDDASAAAVAYTYDVLEDTSNVYSIQLFTQPTEFSFEGTPLTVDFQKFADFYGSETYADDIIQAAFAGTATNFPTGKNLDMSGYDLEARAEIAAKASAYMAVWMYVLREMEHAIYLCETGDCDENSCFGKPAVHEVDEAMAFYTGSLEGADGSGDGVLTYYLADRRAPNFGTFTAGTSKANADFLQVMSQASDNIVAAECQATRDDTTRLVQLMSIPLIQGTLEYTYKTGPGGDSSQKAEAERAVFAASVLPLVAACNSDAADTIYENTKTGATSVDYDAVKAAFADNYECLGLTSEDVGEYATTSTGETTGETSSGSSDVGSTESASGASNMAATLGVGALMILSLFM